MVGWLCVPASAPRDGLSGVRLLAAVGLGKGWIRWCVARCDTQQACAVSALTATRPPLISTK